MICETEPEDPRLREIAACFVVVPDFPISGVSFRNILPVFRNPKLHTLLLDICVERIKHQFAGKIDLIAGLEARGFLFGPSLAERFNCGFVPIRKKGKVPGKIVTVEYTKEYGTDIMEVEADAIKPGQTILLVDDVLATGGSLAGAAQLVEKCHGVMAGSFVIVELSFLGGRKNLTGKLESLFEFNS